MGWEPDESDGPEDVWAREHEDELVGANTESASAMVMAAGFRPFVFHAQAGHALAASKVRGTVVLIATDGVVRRVRQ